MTVALTKTTGAEIDQLVYDLYGLTAEDVGMAEYEQHPPQRHQDTKNPSCLCALVVKYKVRGRR